MAKEVLELKMSVMKLDGVMIHSERRGLSSPQLFLVETAHAVTTLRLVVTDEGVRVLNTRVTDPPTDRPTDRPAFLGPVTVTDV